MQAAQDVRDKIALMRPDLRDGVKDPRVLRYDPADMPIVTVAVSNAPGASLSTRDLTTVADQIVRKRLETVRGVGSVSLVGGVKRQVRIDVKPEKLQALSIGVDQVIRAVQNENQEIPAGPLTSGVVEQTVQVKGRFEKPDDFKRIIVARRGAQSAIPTASSESQPVTLDQLADVTDGQQEPDSMALLNGRRALFLSIIKAQGENTVDVARGVRAEVARLQAQLPPGVQLDITDDSAINIEDSVNEVKRTLLEGALLTVLIVFLFLNSWRSTVITGLTLPIALIGTFWFMYVFGFTINVITLMALSLCVGLLIDDAIVVRENIVRHVQMGADHRKAALDGTQGNRPRGAGHHACRSSRCSCRSASWTASSAGSSTSSASHRGGRRADLDVRVASRSIRCCRSIWQDPDLHDADTGRKGYRYGRMVERSLHLFDKQIDAAHELLSTPARLVAQASRDHAGGRGGDLLRQPLAGAVRRHRVRAEGGLLRNTDRLQHAGRHLARSHRGKRQTGPGDSARRMPEVRFSYATINSGNTQGKNTALITCGSWTGASARAACSS